MTVVPMHRGKAVKEAPALPGWGDSWWLMEDDGTLVVGGWKGGEFVVLPGTEYLARLHAGK